MKIETAVMMWGRHLLMLGLLLRAVGTEKIDVCNGEYLDISCTAGEVVVMESASYGRMENGRCIEVDQYIGCENDVLHLVHKWCSGRDKCNMLISNANNELKQSNKACLRFLMMYLSVEYHCVKVETANQGHCSSQSPISVTNKEGFLSSHMAAETGCGSTRSPWSVEGLPGQTIILSLIDFSDDQGNNQNTSTSDPILYGNIIENDRKTPLYNNMHAQEDIYTSKSNVIQIELMSNAQNGAGFLLKYKVEGCPDLKPPAHAWYKRDGGQAVIGCEWSQKTWHLSCDGRSWSGVVGNCSEPVTEKPIEEKVEIELPSALLLTCVVSVAVVLAAVVLVCGVVCIKKFRIKHEIEKATTMPRQYGHYDLDPNIEMASMMYLPYKPCEHEGILVDVNSQPSTLALCPPPGADLPVSPIHIWQQPLPDVPEKSAAIHVPQALTASGRRGRTPGDGDEGSVGVLENDTLRSGQSDFSSSSGHKYSALNTNG